jgi:hypothetical protein
MVKERNFYKFTTYTLIIFIFLGFLGYSLVQAQTQAFENGISFGQENAINIILKELSENEKLTLQTEQGNITLIPLSIHNKKLIEFNNNIITTANEQGFITLKSGLEQITLIKLQIPEE